MEASLYWIIPQYGTQSADNIAETSFRGRGHIPRSQSHKAFACAAASLRIFGPNLTIDSKNYSVYEDWSTHTSRPLCKYPNNFTRHSSIVQWKFSGICMHMSLQSLTQKYEVSETARNIQKFVLEPSGHLSASLRLKTDVFMTIHRLHELVRYHSEAESLIIGISRTLLGLCDTNEWSRTTRRKKQLEFFRILTCQIHMRNIPQTGDATGFGFRKYDNWEEAPTVVWKGSCELSWWTEVGGQHKVFVVAHW